MNRFSAARLLLATALGLAAASPAMSQQRIVETKITRLSDTVTYSDTERTNYVGYLVEVTNSGGNPVNHVRFEGASFVVNGVVILTKTAPFIPSEGSSCTGSTSIVCSFGQLRSQTTWSFVVFFVAPMRTDTCPGAGCEQVKFTGTTYFAEGTNDAGNPPNDTSPYDPTSTILTDLGTTNSQRVKTGLRKPGGFVFTGVSGVPNSSLGDYFATLLNVPGLPLNYAVAELFEKIPSTSLSAPANEKCPLNVACLNLVNVTVVDQDLGTKQRFEPTTVTDPLLQYLVITLRLDSTLFKGNINNAEVWNFFEGTQVDPNPRWIKIEACIKTEPPPPNPFPTVNGIPADRCIWDRKVFKNNDPEVRANPALSGDGQIRMIAKENGYYAW